jgi:hypothetical protein
MNRATMLWAFLAAALLCPAGAAAMPSVSAGARAGLLALERTTGDGFYTGFAAGLAVDAGPYDLGPVRLRLDLGTVHHQRDETTGSVTVDTGYHLLMMQAAAGLPVAGVEPYISVGPLLWIVNVSMAVDEAANSSTDMQTDLVAALGVRGEHGPLVVRIEAIGFTRGERIGTMVGLVAAWRFEGG